MEEINSDSSSLRLELMVNGEVRQSAKLSEMSIPIHHQISRISTWGPLQGGDFLFTGTPSGVGKLEVGDEMHALLVNGSGEVISEISATCI